MHCSHLKEQQLTGAARFPSHRLDGRLRFFALAARVQCGRRPHRPPGVYRRRRLRHVVGRRAAAAGDRLRLRPRRGRRRRRRRHTVLAHLARHLDQRLVAVRAVVQQLLLLRRLLLLDARLKPAKHTYYSLMHRVLTKSGNKHLCRRRRLRSGGRSVRGQDDALRVLPGLPALDVLDAIVGAGAVGLVPFPFARRRRRRLRLELLLLLLLRLLLLGRQRRGRLVLAGHGRVLRTAGLGRGTGAQRTR